MLLPAGERALRFYPRYDTEPSAIDEALAILRSADRGSRRRTASRRSRASAPKIRVGTLAIPLDTIEIVDLTPRRPSRRCKLQILAVEQERYGAVGEVPAGRAARRTPTAAAVSARDARSDGRQSARDRDRAARPGLRSRSSATRSAARSRTTTRRASAPIRISARTTRSICRRWPRCRRSQNAVELENFCWTRCATRAIAAGFEFLSTLIEERVRDTGPSWFRRAAVLERIENYLRSGTTFAYLQVALANVAHE